MERIFAIVERIEEDRQDEIARASAQPPGGTMGADCVTVPVAIAPFASTPSASTGIATFEDGSRKSLFSFYPDEVSFRATEFVGLTEEEAHSLFQQKDTA